MLIADLGFYSALLLRRLPFVLLTTAALGGAGLYLALSQDPVFRATATILVESPEIPNDLARSTVLENAVVQVQIIGQQLVTGDSLAALADKFDIYPDDVELTPSDIAQDLRGRISVEQGELGYGDRSATSFKVSFDAADPVLAADVANHLATTILQRGSERRADRASETLEFFRQDVARLTQELTGLDSQILRFKSEHLNDLPDSLDFRRLRQGNQEERLMLLDREAATLRSRRANLVMLFETTGRSTIVPIDTPQSQLLAELERALATQSTIFGASSPTVEALRQRIAELTSAVESLPATADDTDGRPTTQLDLQLADIDDQLTALAAEKEAIQTSLATLEASINTTPQNESVLDGLQRDRTNVQALYTLAVQRLAEATTGAEIESRLKGERLSLVEAARPPQDPVPSKRRLVVGAATAGGLGIALAGILGLELLNRRVRRPAELERRLNIQPMVTIPYIESAADQRRRWGTLAMVAAIVVGAVMWPLLTGRLDLVLAELGGTAASVGVWI